MYLATKGGKSLVSNFSLAPINIQTIVDLQN